VGGPQSQCGHDGEEKNFQPIAQHYTTKISRLLISHRCNDTNGLRFPSQPPIVSLTNNYIPIWNIMNEEYEAILLVSSVMKQNRNFLQGTYALPPQIPPISNAKFHMYDQMVHSYTS
jgi:hypothetical protein